MRNWRMWLTLAIVVLAATYFASGVYFVQPDERGVVCWFGRVLPSARKVPSGVHYALPWPFCRVHRPKTTEVRRIYVGLTPEQRQSIADGDLATIQFALANDVLTGDVNILKVTMVVQYQISDPAQYLFGTEDPHQLVDNAVQSVLIDALANLPVDQALTTAKAQLQLETLTRTQRLLDDYGCGLRLLATHLEAIEPPRAIIGSFQEVVSAKKDGEKAVDQAIAESNRILPRARGEAASLVETAHGYRQGRISGARGEAARFMSVLAEYRKAPEILKKRLLLETLEMVLPNVRIYLLDHKAGDPPTKVKIVETGNRPS